ncbi:MAG: flagellar assembly protein FliH [Gammaproteobacteria bacterium HGW-Gammaproteobacteria-4]|jgi:flagellar assembly protein FliH|nr:MAG: flagellar assembly protein FliH [Gammaproteobacteria bacterium HGW-Gammaproteobacteria-4]
MSDPFARDNVSEASRWQLPEFATPDQAKRPRATASVHHLQDLEAQAREEGHAQGLLEGRAAAKLELTQQVARLTAILGALARPLDDVDVEVEQDIAQLAMAVARQLIRRELKTSPDEVIASVREALAALPAAARDVRVSVHPDDALLIRSHLGEAHAAGSWQLLDDPLISRGGCVINTDHSRIDARVETRLARVVGAVLGGQRLADEKPDSDQRAPDQSAPDQAKAADDD